MKMEMMRRLQELEEEKLKERRGKCCCMLCVNCKEPAIYNTYEVRLFHFKTLSFFFQTCGNAENCCETCTKPIPIHVTW